MKIAVFDFCDTIASFQTADPFVEYAMQVLRPKSLFNKIVKQESISSYLNKKGILKSVFLLQLIGITRDALENVAELYYMGKVSCSLNSEIVRIVCEYKRKGYLVFIASGGYDIYLKFFVSEYGLDGLFATKLKYYGNYFSGFIDGLDCMGEEKVRRIENYFRASDIEDSVSYSDSISDMPLLLWAKQGVVVSKHCHRKWVQENGFDEIVLSELKDK